MSYEVVFPGTEFNPTTFKFESVDIIKTFPDADFPIALLAILKQLAIPDTDVRIRYRNNSREWRKADEQEGT